MVFQFETCKLAARKIVAVLWTIHKLLELEKQNDMMQNVRDLYDRVHMLELLLVEHCNFDSVLQRKDRKVVVMIVGLQDNRNNIAVADDSVVHNWFGFGEEVQCVKVDNWMHSWIQLKVKENDNEMRMKDICNNKTIVVHSMVDGMMKLRQDSFSMEESEDNFRQPMDMKIEHLSNDRRVVVHFVASRADNFPELQLSLGCEQLQQALASDSN